MSSIYIVISTMLLLPSICIADCNRGLIYHMEWVQRNLGGGNQCADNVVASPIQINDLADLCMSQVCGTSDNVNNSTELAINLIRDSEFQKTLSQTALEVTGGINELLDETSKEKIRAIEAYHDLQKRNDLIPASSYTRLHDLAVVLKESHRTAYDVGPSHQLPAIVNRKATLAKLADLPKSQRTWVVDNVDHFIRSRIGSDIMLQNITQPREFLRLKYPNLSFKDALKVEGLITQESAAMLLDRPIVRMIAGAKNTLTDPAIRKAANGEDMTDAEVSQFMVVRATAPVFNDVLTAKEQGGQTVLLSSSSRESLADFIKRKKFDQQIAQYDTDLKDPQKMLVSRNVAFQACHTNYTFQMATLPSNLQIEAAEKNGIWAKDRIKQVLGPVVSVQTKGMLNGAIDESFFSMPRNREEFHQYFMDQIKALTANSANTASDYENLIKNGEHKQVTLLNIRLYSEDYTLDKHFKAAQDFCDKFKIKFTSDNGMTSTGRIETSWVSVRKPEFGKAVMLHELGHIAFKNLSSEKASPESRQHFKNIRQCIANNHPENGQLDRYVEEDWSDLISGKGAGPGHSNVGCELNNQENDKYTDLALTDPKSDGNHSTNFFRAIHFHKIQNGKLPSACNQLIESQGTNWKFNSCF